MSDFMSERMPDRELLVHRELLAEAIAELVRNAVEAPRGDDRPKEVRLSWHELGWRLRLRGH